MDVLTVFLIGIVIICLSTFFLNKRSHPGKEVPTMPGNLPIIGNLLNVAPRDYTEFVKHLELGDIFKIKVGPVCFYRLNSYHAIQEAFLGQAEIFSGRMKGEFGKALFHEAGVVNADGPVWQEHRRLSLRLLREFGLGRSTVTDLVGEEISAMVEEIAGNEGRPVITQEIFNSATNNIISRLTFGDRSGTDDEHFKEFTYHLTQTLETKVINTLPFMFPIILKFRITKEIFDYFSGLIYHMNECQGYIKEKIEHQHCLLESMDPPLNDISQASNICEAFLIEKSIQESVNPQGHTFTDMQLIMNMTDLFSAGTETTASTLNWAMLLLSCNPHVQTRLHKEIEDNIGHQRMPTLTDRQNLPYVCAVMDEIMRVSSLVPFNVLHRTTQDTILLGYFIPGDTLIQTNTYGVHHDPSLWKCPNDFYPEHFLSPTGEYCPSKYLIAFSVGKRACLGESLARTEYFIALTSIMQRFKVRLSDPNIDLKSTLNGTMGIIRHPLQHEVTFESIERDL